VPADRAPHCHWEVFIDHEAEPIVEPPITGRVRASRLARVEFRRPQDDAGGGWTDYRRPFDPDFRLEHLSRAALATVCREFLVQNHLLVRALMLSVAQRADDQVARRIATAQWVGAGAVAAGRLRRALGVGDDVGGIAAVLRVHPAFLAPYLRFGVETPSSERARLAIADCEALREGDPYSWYSLLGETPHPALDAMVQAVNPRARCAPATPKAGERLAWDVVVDAAAEPAPMPREAAM